MVDSLVRCRTSSHSLHRPFNLLDSSSRIPRKCCTDLAITMLNRLNSPCTKVGLNERQRMYQAATNRSNADKKERNRQ